MNKDLLKQAAGKSREERAKLLSEYRSSLKDDDLAGVNGGLGGAVENPNSEECPYGGNWVSSFGYVCDGEVVC